MERNIPHVRDIFGGWKDDDQVQTVRVYEYSPRSRRRRDIMDGCDYIDDHTDPLVDSGRVVHARQPDKRRESSEKRKNRPSITTDDFARGEKERNAANKHRGDDAHYSTRTLTDRDIKHLERHLSMKKTIRKQISRNLAQAFVEDPMLLKTNAEGRTPPSQPTKMANDRIFTLTKAKVSKSEQNVLELLKDPPEDTDSGHCSPAHHGSSDDDTTVPDDSESRSTRHTADAKYRKDPPNSESKFSSFWKMFSVKGKGKR